MPLSDYGERDCYETFLRISYQKEIKYRYEEITVKKTHWRLCSCACCLSDRYLSLNFLNKTISVVAEKFA